MGVGSEVYCAVKAGRRAIGAELKLSYYNQAEKNVAAAKQGSTKHAKQNTLLDMVTPSNGNDEA